MRRYMLFIIVMVMTTLSVSCGKKVDEMDPLVLEDTIESDIDIINKADDNDSTESKRVYTVWTTYWQTDNVLEEFNSMGSSIENICYFAAYFDENKKLFIPEETEETYTLIKGTYGDSNYGSYLTFVNDLLKPDGTSSLKDTELLYELFSNEETINAHIDEIMALTEAGGYQGIEIDYEAIRKDMTLWNLFVNFVEKLYQETLKSNIPLRIVLEPSFPAEELHMPEGPEYVIMCYNLYGYGTEPGPKADKDFLQELVQKMKSLPGKVNYALATGGFDFKENGETAQITQKEAVELLAIYDIAPERDEDSKSLVFTYTDEEDIIHEVWYADSYTIGFWSSIIEQEGEYGLSLWRIGGNISN